MIGYRRMKFAGLWKLSRDGYDVIYTRKSFDKETGEEKDSKVRKITSEQVQSQADSLSAHMNALKEDHKDLLEAIEDIKAQVSIEKDDSVTIKFSGFNSNGSAQEYANRILANISRNNLRLTQTPQGFTYKKIYENNSYYRYPNCAIFKRIASTNTSGSSPLESITISGFSGASYGSLIPVNSLITPFRANL